MNRWNDSAPQCTATSKRSGERCRNAAIKGKDVCRLHGGQTPTKHGLYSKYRSGIFQERAEELKATPDLLDVTQYVALLAAMLEKFLEDLKAIGRVGQADRDSITKLVDVIVKCIEKARRLETEQELPAVMNQLIVLIVDVANGTIRNREDRERFAEGVKRIVSDN